MSKRRRLTGIAGVIIVIAGTLFINSLRQEYVVPIIMYHSVNPKSDPVMNRLIVSPKTFEWQMRFLKEQRYNVLPLEALVKLIKEKKIPPKTIAITFDDGYKDNYAYVFPVLKKYNLSATIFIIVNEVGRPQADRLSWDEIKAMQESGLITFGSHTLGPEPLINIKSKEEVKMQIFDSKKILEEKLSRKVNLFSYPEGMFDAGTRQLVIDAGYLAAVATKPGKRYHACDVFALKRVRISENASNTLIFAVETSGFYTFMKGHSKFKYGKK
jgi:peptidoglycan/xylan/chitin deacetylase (PgdA/CDA1 family)